MPRNSDLARGLIRRFLDAGELSVVPPEGSLLATPIGWRTDTLGPHLDAAGRLCR
jgi:hypothetical protein